MLAKSQVVLDIAHVTNICLMINCNENPAGTPFNTDCLVKSSTRLQWFLIRTFNFDSVRDFVFKGRLKSPHRQPYL